MKTGMQKVHAAYDDQLGEMAALQWGGGGEGQRWLLGVADSGMLLEAAASMDVNRAAAAAAAARRPDATTAGVPLHFLPTYTPPTPLSQPPTSL
jgi:hypothetical protein